jgi:hypothetical protein
VGALGIAIPLKIHHGGFFIAKNPVERGIRGGFTLVKFDLCDPFLKGWAEKLFFT